MVGGKELRYGRPEIIKKLVDGYVLQVNLGTERVSSGMDGTERVSSGIEVCLPTE